MRIATKLNACVLAVFAATVVVNYAVLVATVAPKFGEMEASTARASHQRVLAVIDSFADKLRASSQDYAFWDEAYAYASGASGDAFISSNFAAPVEALDGLSVDAVAFLDVHNAMRWEKAINLATKTEMPGLAAEIVATKFEHPYLSGKGEVYAQAGLVATSSGLMLAAVAPIVKSDRSGEPAGTVWMASFLKEDQLRKLAGVNFRIDGAQSAALKLGSENTVQKNDGGIETASTLKDITGRAVAVLTTTTPRAASEVGAAAIRAAAWLMMLAAAVVVIALRFFVQRMVISPLDSLKGHFASAGHSGKLRPTSYALTSDEVGDLAKSFNDMVTNVGQLRNALTNTVQHANNAYFAGMTEWAAGTLHNIRNALSPIQTNAWKIQRLFPDNRLDNLKSCIRQLEASNGHDDRQQKLIAFLVAAASELIENVEKTKSLVGDVISSSKSAQTIASEYERHSQQQSTIEAIDLATLIEDVARVSFMACETPVEVALPTSTATVVGNATVLRQVLQNLFVNAEEAMTARRHERRVCIRLETKPGGVEIYVADNGDGIAAEHLGSIFQRGFSTRTHKRGGLGLHWCSNAIKTFQGTLRAESEGAGKGATFVVYLPIPEAAEAIAA